MKSILGLFLAVCVCSCASIVSRSSYPVTIDSSPTGAKITIRDKGGKMIHEGTAPTTVTLSASKGYFKSARYDVEASLPGHNSGWASLEAGMDAWYIGNILFGGLIGWLIVDPLTGAMWKLDDQLLVTLGAESGS